MSQKGNKGIISIMISSAINGNEVLNRQMNIRLIEACTTGNLALFRELMQIGLYINTPDEYLLTPLMHAVIHGNGEIANELIAAEADINLMDMLRKNALMHAIRNDSRPKLVNKDNIIWEIVINNTDIILNLINRNVDVNNKDLLDYTPLLYASVNNNILVLKTLIEKGADVNYISCDKFSPLLLACYSKSWESASVLVKAGANVNVIDQYGKTPLEYALNTENFTEHKQELLIELLKKGADISIIEKQKIAVDINLISLIKAAEAADILSKDVDAKFADGIDDNNFSVFMDRYIYLLKGKYDNIGVSEQVQKLLTRVSTDEELKNSSIVNQIKEYCKNICEETIINHDPVSSFSPVSDQIDEIPASDINLKIIGDDSSPSQN